MSAHAHMPLFAQLLSAPSHLLCPLQALKARWHLPYGAVVHPLAELAGPVAVANPSGGPIIRCKRCRTYMNPFMQWMDGGRWAGAVAAGWAVGQGASVAGRLLLVLCILFLTCLAASLATGTPHAAATRHAMRCCHFRPHPLPPRAPLPPCRRYSCNVCSMVNEVPVEYFCTLDAAGRRIDQAERPELCSGSVEYIAPAEYMVGLG